MFLEDFDVRSEQVDADGFTNLRELVGTKHREGLRVAQSGSVLVEFLRRSIAKAFREGFTL